MKQKYFPSLLRVMDVFKRIETSQEALNIMQGDMGTIGRFESVKAYLAFAGVNQEKLKVTFLALCELANAPFTLGRMVNKKGEYLVFINLSNPDLPTVIHWRGRFIIKSLTDFITNSRIKFIPA